MCANSPAVHQGTVTEDYLYDIVSQRIPRLTDPWPSDRDVLRAFRVYDSEGLGFIKVTLLKRFLVQSHLDVEDSVCKLPKHWLLTYYGCITHTHIQWNV